MMNLKFLYTLIVKSNFFKTILFNFRCFPFRTAIQFPVRVIGKTKLIGLYQGCVCLHDDQNIKPFSILIGVVAFDSTLCSQIKFSDGAKLYLGSGVKFHSGVNLSINKNATLSLGDDVLFNHNSFIACSNRIKIGNHVSFGWNIQLLDSDFHTMYDSEKQLFISPLGDVEIGDYVWIGNHTSISKNARIPAHSIVTSYSLYNKDFSEIDSIGNLFAGIPAKLKKTGIHRILDLEVDKLIQTKFNGQTSLSRDSIEANVLKSLDENFGL